MHPCQSPGACDAVGIITPLYRWEPEHPHAIKSGPKKGYVAYPQINMTAEMVDALVAARAYDANLGAMEISKNSPYAFWAKGVDE